MFCGKCGNEIKNGEKVCGKCGTPVENSTNGKTFAGKSAGNPLMNTFNSSMSNDKKLMIMMVLTAVTQLLFIPLWYAKFLTVGKSVLSVSASMYDACGGGEYWYITTVMFALFVVAAATALLPIIKKDLYKRRRFIFQKVMSIICFAFFLLEVIGVSDNASKYHVDCSVTFVGWLFALNCIAGFVLTIMASSQIKKHNSQSVA